MCGIVGAVGEVKIKEYLVQGLKDLDYRGYDSAGIALVDKKVAIYKAVGEIAKLEAKLPKDNVKYKMGIGHTRWATHGVPNERNCHPVTSHNKLVTLVHNGVIGNYLDLKQSLLEEGYSFYSETDSEVIANVIEKYYRAYGDPLRAMSKACSELSSSFAFIAIFNDIKDCLFVAKKSSPMIIGEGNGYNLIASDSVPIIPFTHKLIELADNQIARVDKDSVQLYDFDLIKMKKIYSKKDADLLSKDLGGYPHYMLKEIEEILPITKKLMLNSYRDGHFLFEKNMLKAINKSDEIIFIGCGTSYHASLVGARYFRDIGKNASCFIASEWAYYPQFPGRTPFVILLSQSGETADLIHCLKIIKQHNIKTLIITNTKGSTLERGADYSILLNAGLEVSVASTKAYVAQVCSLAILTSAIANNHLIIEDLDECAKIISHTQECLKEKIQDMAKELKDSKDIFYLGRGYDYDLSLEASLKLKEISYIHSEAVPGGELKHGPIALIEEGTPVIVFVTDPVSASSMRANIQEVKARGAKVFVISSKQLSDENDYLIVNDYNSKLSSIAISSIAFYFAYYVSSLKGLNVDKPRNLAKSVTVE